MKLDKTDQLILKLVQGDLPMEEMPFDELASETGLDADTLIEKILELKDKGIIRGFKAVVRHYRINMGANAMVVWSVPDNRLSDTAKALSSMDNISHCYERHGLDDYNLFTMIHGRNKKDVEKTIEKAISLLGFKKYRVYWTKRELKKTSMQYIKEED